MIKFSKYFWWCLKFWAFFILSQVDTMQVAKTVNQPSIHLFKKKTQKTPKAIF